jgi:hypothetical protein
MEMIERRISDVSILRLIRKCISVGVIDDGRLLLSETGTGQGKSSAHCSPTCTSTSCSISGSSARSSLHGKVFRLRRSLKCVAEWCQTHRHYPVDWQQAILNAKLRGHYQYYGRPHELPQSVPVLSGCPADLEEVARPAAQGRTLTWEKYAQLLHRHPLLRPRITRSWAGTVSLT